MTLLISLKLKALRQQENTVRERGDMRQIGSESKSMENPFSAPSLWDVPLAKTFQSIVETAREQISQEFSLFHLCLSLSLSFTLSSLFPPRLYLSLTKSLLSSLLRFMVQRDRTTKKTDRTDGVFAWVTMKEFGPKKRSPFSPADYHKTCLKNFWQHAFQKRTMVHLCFGVSVLYEH